VREALRGLDKGAASRSYILKSFVPLGCIARCSPLPPVQMSVLASAINNGDVKVVVIGPLF
jgi:hypothetical protein